jgi:O-antigen ligase
MALVGAVQYYTGTSFFFSERYEHAGEQRAIGTLPAVVDYGMVLSSGAVAAAVLLLRRPRLPKACVLAGAFVIIMGSVMLNKTRAVWVGVAVGLFITFVLERRFRRTLFATAAVAVVAGLLAYPFLVDSDFFKGRVMAVHPIYNRIAIYATAINMILHRPIFGGGFGRYMFLEDKWEYLSGFGDVSSTWAVFPGVPHDEYLHVLALVGLVGFLPYAFVLVSSWRTLRRSYACLGADGSAGADTTLVALAVLGVYLANGLFSDLLFAINTSNQVYVLLGAADGFRVRAAGETPSPPEAA